MKLTKEKVKQLFEENGYYISDYILSKAYISLRYLLAEDSVGQKIYSSCLDGPSGAGKTHFVDVYCKVASILLGRNVKFINFQLDAETGKSDLYEDIDVVATFENDLSKIRIPGKIVEAIKAVNEGDYVILKMDEYDKARDVTDTFFNNFLQEALVNTTQHGNVYIEKEATGKLQVFLCKNDLRAELSEPMMRRNRIVRLDYMTPERMHQILSDFSKKHDCPPEILNMVTLFYEEMYLNKQMYTKLPSCSECQQAIVDAKLLLEDSEFSQKDIYINIIENMLKMEDDIKSFESLLSQENTENAEKLNKFVKSMKESDQEQDIVDLKTRMANTIFEDKCEELRQKISEMNQLIDEYKTKFATMEAKRQQAIAEEIERISLKNGNLVSSGMPTASPNFQDESLLIKRGHNIFEISQAGWTDVATISAKEIDHFFTIEKMLENINKLGITLYENGLLLKEDGAMKLIAIRDIDENAEPRYRIMASYPIIPATYLRDIEYFYDVLHQIKKEQPQTVQQIANAALGISPSTSITLNALVYNDDDSLAVEFKSIDENIYHVEKNATLPAEDNSLIITMEDVSCDNPANAITAAEKLLAGKQKVKTYE